VLELVRILDNLLKTYARKALSKIEKKFGQQKIDLLINNHKTNEAIFDITKNSGTRI